jgi:hypothetical protein
MLPGAAGADACQALSSHSENNHYTWEGETRSFVLPDLSSENEQHFVIFVNHHQGPK